MIKRILFIVVCVSGLALIGSIHVSDIKFALAYAVLLISLFLWNIHIPKEAVLLSSELGKMIQNAKQAHLELLNAYTKEREERIDEYVTNIYLPKFMKNFAGDAEIERRVAEVKNNSEKLDLLAAFTESGVGVIVKLKEGLRAKLKANLEPLLKAQIEHYELLSRSNETLTEFLGSAYKSTQANEKIISILKKSVEGIPHLDAIKKKMDEILHSVDATLLDTDFKKK